MSAKQWKLLKKRRS